MSAAAECSGDTIPFHDYNCPACAPKEPMMDDTDFATEVDPRFLDTLGSIFDGFRVTLDNEADNVEINFTPEAEKFLTGEHDPETCELCNVDPASEIEALTQTVIDLDDENEELSDTLDAQSVVIDLHEQAIESLQADFDGMLAKAAFLTHTLQAIQFCPEQDVVQSMAANAVIAVTRTEEESGRA